jgi:hypothetical protein
MDSQRYSSKVVYYGGYPGASGKPVGGRLRFDGERLAFEPPRGSDEQALNFGRERLLGVRRDEEGMTGARRLRLLVDVATEQGARATLKFEMAGIGRKGGKLQRWLDVLGHACRGSAAHHDGYPTSV